MSYNSQMFARMADELERIGDEVIDSAAPMDMDSDDMFRALDALNKLVCSDENYDELSALAMAIATCGYGGMYEAFQELPEAKEVMLEKLLKDAGYDFVSDVGYTMWVKKED